MDTKFWTEVAKIVEGFGIAELKIGEDTISLNMQRYKMKLIIVVYVNRTVSFKEQEKQQPYWYETTRYLLSGVRRKKYAEKIIKHFGKRKGTSILDKDHELYNAKRTSYSPFFPSMKALKTQYSKRFDNIELINRNTLEVLEFEGM